MAGASHLKYHSSKKVTVIPAHLVSMNPNLNNHGGNQLGGGTHSNLMMSSVGAPGAPDDNLATQSFNATQASNISQSNQGGTGVDDMGVGLSSFDKQKKPKHLSINHSIDNNFVQNSTGNNFGNGMVHFTRNLVQSPQMLQNSQMSKMSKFDMLPAEQSLDMHADAPLMPGSSYNRKFHMHQSPMVKSEKKQVSRYQGILCSPKNASENKNNGGIGQAS